MSSGCEGGWAATAAATAGYTPTGYCYPATPMPHHHPVHHRQWSPTHHYHHHHHHAPHHHFHHHHLPMNEFCGVQQNPVAPPPGLVPYADGSSHPPCPPHYWDGDELIDACGRVVRRKTSANKKERRRTQSINNAFAELRECIPNVPADTKLSKIKTLRLATSYIAYLMEVLHNEDPQQPQQQPQTQSSQSFRTEMQPSSTTPRGPVSQELSLGHEKQEDSDMDTEPVPTSTSIGDRGVMVGHTPPGVPNPSPCSMASPVSSSSSTSTAPPLSDMGVEKRRGGRTGWPETVWAQELKH